MQKTGVVYLSRKGNPAHWTGGFLDSLAANGAGAEFTLAVVLKGYDGGEEDRVLAARRRAINAPLEILRVDDEIYPIEVWFRAAAALAACDRLVFLNSQSRVLAPQWLAKLLDPFERITNCGAVGASGSFEGLTPDAFPNVHLRTTGFAIARATFLALDKGAQATKYDGNRFEAGADGFTRQLERSGLAPLVVDGSGKVWRSGEWAVSRTFRSGRQEGLLVADNRTRAYAVAGLAKRQRLARAAFGDAACAEGSSLVSRWRARRRFY